MEKHVSHSPVTLLPIKTLASLVWASRKEVFWPLRGRVNLFISLIQSPSCPCKEPPAFLAWPATEQPVSNSWCPHALSSWKPAGGGFLLGKGRPRKGIHWQRAVKHSVAEEAGRVWKVHYLLGEGRRAVIRTWDR